MASVDPQIGWEVQKFFIAWTIGLIKANEKTPWLDSMRLYRLGQNANPRLDRTHRVARSVDRRALLREILRDRMLFGDAANDCAGRPLGAEGHRRRACSIRERAHEPGLSARRSELSGGRGVPRRLSTSSGAPWSPTTRTVRRSSSPIPPSGRITGLGMLQGIPACDQNVEPECTHAHRRSKSLRFRARGLQVSRRFPVRGGRRLRPCSARPASAGIY
jgi:hypothetical protein